MKLLNLVIEGGPGCGKSRMAEHIAAFYASANVCYIHCAGAESFNIHKIFKGIDDPLLVVFDDIANSKTLRSAVNAVSEARNFGYPKISAVYCCASGFTPINY